MRYELYKFNYGTNEWLFTSNVRSVTFNENVYKPVRGLSRDEIEDSGIDKADFDITFPQISLLNNDGFDLSKLFINKIYIETVYVEIIELNGSSSLVLFRGRVTKPSFDENQRTMNLTVSSEESYQNRNILTRKFQRSCPNKIYDRYCGVDFNRWSSKAIVSSISGLSVTLSYEPTITVDESTNEDGDNVKVTTTINSSISTSQPMTVTKTKVIVTETTNHETGEVTTTTTSEVIFTREDNQPYSRGLIVKDGVEVYVVNSNGLILGLYRAMPNLKTGDIVYIAMGCDQSRESCKTFENHKRYMGFPDMPNTNPFNDQIIK